MTLKSGQVAIAAAIALAAAVSQAQAALISVDFTVNPGGWFGSGSPFGVGSDPTFTGNVVLDNTVTNGSTFTSISFVTGSKTWTLGDINTGASGATFSSGALSYFDLVFTNSSYVYSNNTVGLYDGPSYQACNSCVSIDSTTFVGGGVPEPATWAMMIAGFAGVGAALRSSRRRVALAA